MKSFFVVAGLFFIFRIKRFQNKSTIVKTIGENNYMPSTLSRLAKGDNKIAFLFFFSGSHTEWWFFPVFSGFLLFFIISCKHIARMQYLSQIFWGPHIPVHKITLPREVPGLPSPVHSFLHIFSVIFFYSSKSSQNTLLREITSYSYCFLYKGK